MGQAGPYTACAVLARYGYGSGLETAVMGFTGARNDKPPAGMRGGLTPVGETDYAEVADRRNGSLVPYTGLSTYLYASAILDGETTRRTGLNLDRGGQPQDAQRVAGKREWQQVGRTSAKSSPQRMAPSVINSARSRVRRTLSLTPCGFTISHQGLNHGR